ncbi:MAG: Carboxypeptidase regulatory-like domain [Cyanobacteria bacterium RYN_339]|nr:Carboxypeptidase regulatory-like domain [Cyanobacteria bacterium RYN_339]
MRLLILALAATSLTACTLVVNPGVLPPLPAVSPSPKVSPKPSVAPSIAPTSAPSAVPTTVNTVAPTATPFQHWSPTPLPSVAPTSAPSVAPSAPSTGSRTTIISGTVYDEQGATVDGAIVKVTSLDASVPYQAVATTSEGSWVVNNVPPVNVEVRATKDGYTTRWRVGSFQTVANQKNILNFDGAYFISKYPEVARVEHLGETVAFTFSETLDAVNRRRFEDAVRIVPAGGASGDAIANHVSAGVSLTWDAENLVATMKVPSNLLTAAKYEAVVMGSNSDRIVDKDNNPLGTDAQNTFNNSTPSTERVRHVFRIPEPPTLGAQDTTAGLRWAATHSDSAGI